MSVATPPHRPAPLHAAAPGHGHGHTHGSAHDPAHVHPHGDGHAHHHAAPAAPQVAALPASLLMAGAGGRLLGAAGLLVLLWLAVAWALGEPA